MPHPHSLGSADDTNIVLGVLDHTGRDCFASFGDSAILFRILELVFSLHCAGKTKKHATEIGVNKVASLASAPGVESATPEANEELVAVPAIYRLRKALLDTFTCSKPAMRRVAAGDGSSATAELSVETKYRQGVLLCFLRQRLASQEAVNATLQIFVSSLSSTLCKEQQHALHEIIKRRKESAGEGSPPRSSDEVGVSAIVGASTLATEQHARVPSRPSLPRPQAKSPRQRCSRSDL